MEGVSPSCYASDIPVLDFWWYFSKVSKPGWIPCLDGSSDLFLLWHLTFWRPAWQLSCLIHILAHVYRPWWDSNPGSCILNPEEIGYWVQHLRKNQVRESYWNSFFLNLWWKGPDTTFITFNAIWEILFTFTSCSVCIIHTLWNLKGEKLKRKNGEVYCWNSSFEDKIFLWKKEQCNFSSTV